MSNERPTESRLSRWSKRKQALREAETAARMETSDLPGAEEKTKNDQALSEQQQSNRAAAEAVDLDNLNEDSDYSIFMKDGVPDALKRKAYRLLWRSNPVLANLDGLNEYDEDYGDASLIMKTFQSAWSVERGYETAEPEAVPSENDVSGAEESETADEAGEEERSRTDDVAEAPDTENEDTELEQTSRAAKLSLSNGEAPVREEINARAPETNTKISLRRRLMPDS